MFVKPMVKSRGFTLAEILVATFIFGVIALLAFQSIRGWVQQETKLKVHFEQLGQLQRTYHQLQQDIAHASIRPIRDNLGDAQNAMRVGLGSHVLALSTHNQRRGVGQSIRVAYRLDGRVTYALEGAIWAGCNCWGGSGCGDRVVAYLSSTGGDC